MGAEMFLDIRFGHYKSFDQIASAGSSRVASAGLLHVLHGGTLPGKWAGGACERGLRESIDKIQEMMFG
jgi:hypothetical protein